MNYHLASMHRESLRAKRGFSSRSNCHTHASSHCASEVNSLSVLQIRVSKSCTGNAVASLAWNQASERPMRMATPAGPTANGTEGLVGHSPPADSAVEGRADQVDVPTGDPERFTGLVDRELVAGASRRLPLEPGGTRNDRGHGSVRRPRRRWRTDRLSPGTRLPREAGGSRPPYRGGRDR